MPSSYRVLMYPQMAAAVELKLTDDEKSRLDLTFIDPPTKDEKWWVTQRRYQISIGKNTRGYRNYIANVSPEQRTKNDPTTPRADDEHCSKRGFASQLCAWRKRLHAYD